MATNSIFPTQVWQNRLSSINSRLKVELLEDCYLIKRSDKDGRLWSEKNYKGGYTSYGSLSQVHKMTSSFETLARSIDIEVRKYIKLLQYDIRPSELMMTRMWINIMGPSCYHKMHIHPLSVVSGTYYLSVPKNSSCIRFEDPRHPMMMASPPKQKKLRTENQNFIDIKPKSGEVLLFESWLRHEVPENLTKEDRVSISFNYDWI